MKKNKSTIILVIVFIIGLSLLLYPSVSNYWNSIHQSKAISVYLDDVKKKDNRDYKRYFSEAEKYNKSIGQRKPLFDLSKSQKKKYNSLLDVEGTGMMGYIEIPAIRVMLPIYHGVSDDILQVAVGHLEWSSLPVGGKGTHCVLSGHRGLPSSMLFTDLDKLVEGDVFMLNVLDEVFAYQVDKIRIVEPDQVRDLTINKLEDYCTLVTCTPYGVNSHRLLVRGHRIPNSAIDSALISSDAIQINPIVVAPAVAAPILLILLIAILIPRKKD